MSYIGAIFQILGSLAFFIFGMKIMSDGIQKAAGDGLRAILRAMTYNRYLGVLTGILITSIIQSSSATTVMTVSFVNAGILSLIESGGIMMGANIGTTTTAWLVSFLGFKVKLSVFCIPLLAFGVPMFLIRNNSIKNWGQFIIGFALLFLGLDELKNAVPDLKNNPVVLDFLSTYSSPALLTRIGFVFVGALITIIVQSSSAAMALTLVLVGQGLPLEVAAAMVLGENIGTTITAELASLVGNVHAKRSAKIHSLFNIIGVFWMVLLLPIFTGYIEKMFDKTQMQLSMFHTTFNVLNVLILIWFLPAITKLAVRLVKSKNEEDEAFSLDYITGLMATPEFSIMEASKEVYRFGKYTNSIVFSTSEILTEIDSGKYTKKKDKILRMEQITDDFEREIIDFLATLSKENLSNATTNKVKQLIYVTDNLESIADSCAELVQYLDKRKKLKAYFTPEIRDNIQQMEQLLAEASRVNLNNLSVYSNGGKVDATEAKEIENQINAAYKKMTSEMIKNIKENQNEMAVSVLFYRDILNTYERIADHFIDISISLQDN